MADHGHSNGGAPDADEQNRKLKELKDLLARLSKNPRGRPGKLIRGGVSRTKRKSRR